MYTLNHKIFSLYELPKYLPLGLLNLLRPLLFFDSNQNLLNLKNQNQTHLSDYKFNQKPHTLTIHARSVYLGLLLASCELKATCSSWPSIRRGNSRHQQPQEEGAEQRPDRWEAPVLSQGHHAGLWVLATFSQGFSKVRALPVSHTATSPLELIRLWKEQPVHPCPDGLVSFLENSTHPDWGRYCTPSSSLFYPLGMQSILC